MRVGLIIPQGWTGDYDGWEPRAAWLRSVEVAQLAERLGFESIWLFDHFHTVEPDATGGCAVPGHGALRTYQNIRFAPDVTPRRRSACQLGCLDEDPARIRGKTALASSSVN